jgi:uncharacterized protein YciI
MTCLRCLCPLVLAWLAFGADGKKAPASKPEPTYEMTTYIMGLLRKGPIWTAADTPETQRLQAGHMANIQKMAATGKLIVAGPFTDDGDLRGIFIFEKVSLEEARAMVSVDPAVKAGRLIMDLHPWFAAAGLRVNAPKPPQ